MSNTPVCWVTEEVTQRQRADVLLRQLEASGSRKAVPTTETGSATTRDSDVRDQCNIGKSEESNSNGEAVELNPLPLPKPHKEMPIAMTILTEEQEMQQQLDRDMPVECPNCGLAVRMLMGDVARQFVEHGQAYIGDIQLLRSHFHMCCTKVDQS